MATWRKVAAGDYETADGRYRMWRVPDVRPPAWNVEDVETCELWVDGAATKADAEAIFADSARQRTRREALAINPEPLKVVDVLHCAVCRKRAPWCSCGKADYR